MNIQLNENGIEIAALPDIIDALIDDFRRIYGEDINLALDTPDGQRIAIYSRIAHECLVLIKKLYQNLKPDQAEGLHLDYLARINGLYRRAEETDAELRRRRLRTFEAASQSTIGGIAARLNLVKGVTDAVVYENDTHEHDAKLNLSPHSIWIVAEGGDGQDITDCIARNKTGGTGMKGKITGKYSETIPRQNGSDYTVTHEYRFDRPVITPVKIRLTATREVSNEPVPVQEIKDELSKSLYRIGEHIKVTSLYCTLNRIARSYYVSGLAVSKDGSTWESSLLKTGYDERFLISGDNIAVDEVVT